MEEYAIEVKDLKVRYRCLNKISIKKSLFHMKKSNTEVFEALHGVSFNVKPGEIVGIIGKNGSGNLRCSGQSEVSFPQMRDTSISMDIPYHYCRSVLDFRKTDRTGKYPVVRDGVGI